MWTDLQGYFRMLVASIAKSEEGQTLVEYGLIIALVSVALIVALGTMTTALNGVFSAITSALNGA
jgi:pilus assembly protein Flp/PilA